MALLLALPVLWDLLLVVPLSSTHLLLLLLGPPSAQSLFVVAFDVSQELSQQLVLFVIEAISSLLLSERCLSYNF